MLDQLFGNLFDKEKIITETVQTTLVDVAEELRRNGPVAHSDFFIMIRPMDANFNFKYFICKYDEKGNPKKIRELTTKEILGEK